MAEFIVHSQQPCERVLRAVSIMHMCITLKNRKAVVVGKQLLFEFATKLYKYGN